MDSFRVRAENPKKKTKNCAGSLPAKRTERQRRADREDRGQKRANREDKWTGRSWQRVQKDRDELTGQKDRDSQHRGQKDSGHL